MRGRRSVTYDVRDKVVLITGAGDGVGLGLARELGRRGARLALLDVNATSASQAAASLSGAIALVADVRDRRGMARAVRATVEHFGRLDIVVANAGVVPPPASLRTIDPESFDRVIDINLRGVFNTVHPSLDQIVERQGHVVVVASCAAFSPSLLGSPYMISKAGVEQLSRALRLELAPHGASATTAYFGIIDTTMTRTSVDGDPVGKQLEARLPRALRQRISAEQAALVLAEAIGRRAPRVIAPAAWKAYQWSRGFANTLIDHKLVHDRDVYQLVHEVEASCKDRISPS